MCLANLSSVWLISYPSHEANDDLNLIYQIIANSFLLPFTSFSSSCFVRTIPFHWPGTRYISASSQAGVGYLNRKRIYLIPTLNRFIGSVREILGE
jgi:hypothetical protein